MHSSSTFRMSLRVISRFAALSAHMGRMWFAQNTTGLPSSCENNIGFRWLAQIEAVNARTRDAGDDREYRCRTRPILVGPHQGQANRPGPGPGLHVRHAVSADLFDAIGLADRCGGAARDDRPAERTYPRLQVQVRLGAISRSIRSAVHRTCARAA